MNFKSRDKHTHKHTSWSDRLLNCLLSQLETTNFQKTIKLHKRNQSQLWYLNLWLFQSDFCTFRNKLVIDIKTFYVYVLMLHVATFFCHSSTKLFRNSQKNFSLFSAVYRLQYSLCWSSRLIPPSPSVILKTHLNALNASKVKYHITWIE